MGDDIINSFHLVIYLVFHAGHILTPLLVYRKNESECQKFEIMAVNLNYFFYFNGHSQRK